jgi:hypothetical protein
MYIRVAWQTKFQASKSKYYVIKNGVRNDQTCLARFTTVDGRAGNKSDCADCDPIGIANLHHEWEVIDARLDERQRYLLQRNGKGLLAIEPLGVADTLAQGDHHLRHHLHRGRRIGKSVSHGDGDCGADACDGHDGRDYGRRLPRHDSSEGCDHDRRGDSRQPGHSHWRSHEQRVYMVAGGLRRRPYRVDYPEQSRGGIANGADARVGRESHKHRLRRLVDAFMVVDQCDRLQQPSLPRGALGSVSVSPTVSATCNVTCTGSGPLHGFCHERGDDLRRPKENRAFSWIVFAWAPLG